MWAPTGAGTRPSISSPPHPRRARRPGLRLAGRRPRFRHRLGPICSSTFRTTLSSIVMAGLLVGLSFSRRRDDPQLIGPGGWTPSSRPSFVPCRCGPERPRRSRPGRRAPEEELEEHSPELTACCYRRRAGAGGRPRRDDRRARRRGDDGVDQGSCRRQWWSNARNWCTALNLLLIPRRPRPRRVWSTLIATSPTANNPGRLVSNGSGRRPSALQLSAQHLIARARSVRTKPSGRRAPAHHAADDDQSGSAPMNENRRRRWNANLPIRAVDPNCLQRAGAFEPDDVRAGHHSMRGDGAPAGRRGIATCER